MRNLVIPGWRPQLLKKVRGSYSSTIAPGNVLETLQSDHEGFLKIAEIIQKRAGINLPLNDKNLLMVAGRVNPLFRKYSLNNYQEYLKLLENGQPQYVDELLAAVTTHTTEFFREPAHFDLLKKVLPETLKNKGPNPEIRIWCAASSTGQEPYTIAMTVFEAMKDNKPFSLKMLATDIDSTVLEKATDAFYTPEEIEKIPPHLVEKYFRKVEIPKRGYQATKELRESIRFARFNLMESSYPFKFPFDFIFCRNVLIYFNRPTAEQVAQKLLSALNLDGYLFLGHSESGVVRTKNVRVMATGFYQRKS